MNAAKIPVTTIIKITSAITASISVKPLSLAAVLNLDDVALVLLIVRLPRCPVPKLLERAHGIYVCVCAADVYVAIGANVSVTYDRRRQGGRVAHIGCNSDSARRG